MDHLLQALDPWLRRYGYLAVFAAIFLEDFGVPMPGETLLIAGALLASQGSFAISVLMITAWCAAVLGDNVGYAIGRFGGRRLVLGFGRYVLITESRLAHAERFFASRGATVVIIARFIEILRQLNGIMAGIAGMRWWRFLLYNALGAGLWVGFWSVLFFHLGRQGRRVVFLVKQYEPLAVGILAALIAVVIVLRILLRRRHKEPRDARSGSPG